MEKKITVKGFKTPIFKNALDKEVEINGEVIKYKEYSYLYSTDTWEFSL